MPERLRVLHLAGSAVNDFFAELSLLYARGCWTATADPDRYEFHAATVTPDGRWRVGTGMSEAELAAEPSTTPAEAVARIAALAPDVVVPQMFCRPGMTSYRALFDVLAIPYVGNTAEVMALGADKAKARAVVAAAGIDVPAGRVVRPGDAPADVVAGFTGPVVVKPVDADNSVGVTLVRDPADLGAALAAAFEHSSAALVETYVELGREVRCGVLERDGQLVALPLEEYRLDARDAPIRDRADKLGRDATGQLTLMAKDGERAWIVDPTGADPVTRRVWEAARGCYRALGCRHYGLFDFRIDPDGRPWFLEAGLYNSFAPSSVVTMMAAAGGTTLPDLFAEMLAQAVG